MHSLVAPRAAVAIVHLLKIQHKTPARLWGSPAHQMVMALRVLRAVAATMVIPVRVAHMVAPVPQDTQVIQGTPVLQAIPAILAQVAVLV